MIRNIGLALLLISVAACSKTTRFEIRNDSEQPVKAVTVSKSGSPKVLGQLAPGETQTVELQAIFENNYRLTYEQNGRKLWNYRDRCESPLIDLMSHRRSSIKLPLRHLNPSLSTRLRNLPSFEAGECVSGIFKPVKQTPRPQTSC